jgi:hypothetical protein
VSVLFQLTCLDCAKNGFVFCKVDTFCCIGGTFLSGICKLINLQTLLNIEFGFKVAFSAKHEKDTKVGNAKI